MTYRKIIQPWSGGQLDADADPKEQVEQINRAFGDLQRILRETTDLIENGPLPGGYNILYFTIPGLVQKTATFYQRVPLLQTNFHSPRPIYFSASVNAANGTDTVTVDLQYNTTAGTYASILAAGQLVLTGSTPNFADSRAKFSTDSLAFNSAATSWDLRLVVKSLSPVNSIPDTLNAVLILQRPGRMGQAGVKT